MRGFFRFIYKCILFVVVIVVIYFVVAIIFSIIPVAKEPNAEKAVGIYILSNGVHTDIVVPVKYKNTDWQSFIPVKNTLSKDANVHYIAFGWGDKGFYLETPTWADLKFTTAVAAMSGFNNTAMHTTYYKSLHENDRCKKMYLNEGQYQRLCAFIKKSFQLDALGESIYIPTNMMYGRYDAFYEAAGHYSILYTCNTWTNDALKSCGQRACRWTPFEQGIFFQYR